MNKNNTKRSLLLSVLSLLMCCSMLVGSTFAWFTDSVTSSNNKIQSGTLKLDLELLKDGEFKSIKESTDPIYNYQLWEPGYTDVKVFKIENEGSLALKWYAKFVCSGELTALADVIDVYVCPSETEITAPTDRNLVGYTKVGTLKEFVNTIETTTTGHLTAKSSAYLGLVLKMREEAGNEYQNMALPAFDIMILATQDTVESDSFGKDYDANAEYDKPASKWDGTVDTSWYDENPDAREFTIDVANDLAGLAKLVDSGVNFEGVTLKVTTDIDLGATDENGNPVSFNPIGDKEPFKGTLDGQGHTISNLYQSGWDFGYEWGKYGSIGLFGELESATIKNLTISGFDAQVEGGDIGGITGSATGTCVFENITIENSNFGTYNNGIGGIIGWSGDGNYTFKNITLAEDLVLGGLWGSFDSSIGGVVGQAEPGATYNFENVDIKCRLDAYNDCTASYDYYNYRMTGMIIGRLEETITIDGVNYPDTSKYNITCKDVTVTYGDWANYHYCEPTPGLNGGRGMRVEPGYTYSGLPADYDHSQCVDNHMNLIPLDQIFGGDQIAVKGLKAYEGVTVVYNNK